MQPTKYPSIQHTGINDKSQRVNPIENAPLSQHTPLFLLMTQMGRGGVKIIPSNDFTTLYGEKTLEENSKYYNHQSEAAQVCIGAGNSTIAVKRVIPDDSITASMSFGVDSLLPDDWFLADKPSARNSDTYTAIFEAEMDNEGEWGNQYGFSLTRLEEGRSWVLGMGEEIAVYEFKLVKLDDFGGIAQVIPNNFGSHSTFVTLKPNSIGRNDIDFYINSRVTKMYFQPDSEVSTRPLLKYVKFYIDNFTKLAKASPNYDPKVEIWNQDIDSLYNHDVIGFNMFNGEHHFAMTGGSDGFKSDLVSYIEKRLERVKVYDENVRLFFESITDSSPYVDVAKYPFSMFWDTGFSYDTKVSARNLLKHRADVGVILSCFTVADKVKQPDGQEYFNYISHQTEEQLQAIGSKLKLAYSLYPESIYYGTSAVRVGIVKHSGVKNNSAYPKRRSVAIHLIEQISRYMGRGDGKWRESAIIDHESNRIIDGWSDLDVEYQPPSIKQRNFDNNLISLEPFDSKRYYFPFLTTIYPDETSILRDLVVMFACLYLERAGAAVLRKHIGDNSRRGQSKLDAITRDLQNEVRHAFHGRFNIEAEVLDETDGPYRGIHAKYKIYSPKANTSNSYSIQANRMAELL